MDKKQSFTERVLSWPVRVKNYIGELQAEMRRVTWPTWKQVRATTAVVIAAVFAFAAYFFVVDYILGRAITKVFDTFTR
ncbi:MAG: preprotein translocase subunit SecE [Bryobacterales bacterium]|nr:preprotein translocase subunit SecE [Bryobacteraceae bacterium]MDW8355393.1 preprotein translocase subunit SecE [Bryobacterales bacterium]